LPESPLTSASYPQELRWQETWLIPLIGNPFADERGNSTNRPAEPAHGGLAFSGHRNQTLLIV